MNKISQMERYICENVFVPLRSGPSHKTEMMSQVLFGEKYTIIDKSGHWIKIETAADNYPGWLDSDHLQNSSDEEISEGIVLNRSLLCYKNDKTRMVLEAGCVIYNTDFDNKSFKIGKNSYRTAEEFNPLFVSSDESLAETGMKFMNSPYIWGGRLPSGIDCSGFTQLVYKIHGIHIPRDSWQQAEKGKTVDFIDSARPGDLVFFDDDRGTICHVGMMFSQGLVIHSSGRVRIDSIDHQGIFKKEKNDYSHRLRLIRRIIE